MCPCNQVLKVTNTSPHKVVFKVKTTQPSWYYVRPNQQVVDVGKTEEVVIVLVDAECARFLECAARGVPEKLDKHRFLVQTKTLEDAEYDAIVALQPGQRTEGVSAFRTHATDLLLRRCLRANARSCLAATLCFAHPLRSPPTHSTQKSGPTGPRTTGKT
jgi:hypothetical protein